MKMRLPHAGPKRRKPLTLMQFLAIVGFGGWLANIVLRQFL
jgi:hypothetical protein